MTIEQVIFTIKKGGVVTFAGDPVSAEGITYSWQVPSLWVNLINGSSYRAGYKEIKSMRVVNN